MITLNEANGAGQELRLKNTGPDKRKKQKNSPPRSSSRLASIQEHMGSLDESAVADNNILG